MSIKIEPIVRSRTIIWLGVEKELCSVTVIDGAYIDPEAVEIQAILKNQTEFNQFIKAIQKAIKDTAV